MMGITVDDKPSSQSKSGASKPFSSSARSVSAPLSEFFSPPGKTVAGTDFVTLEAPAPRAVGLLFGRDGGGKSTFVTDHCPEDVFLLNLDNRAEEAAYSAISKGRTVHYLAGGFSADVLSMDHETAKSYAQQVLDRVIRNYEAAVEILRKKGRGTVAIDTVKELGDLVKLAVRGRVDRPAGTKEDKGDFGKSDSVINRQLWYFPNRVREARGVNLIMIARAKEIYEDREGTGRYTWDCDKIFHAACDWAMEIRKASIGDKEARLAEEGSALSTAKLLKLRSEGTSFELQVEKGGCAIDEEGKVYSESEWGEDGPFAYACSKLIPRTSIEDWR